jgi:hypothetical protein
LKILWQRNLTLFWCADLISSLGDEVLFVALPFAIYLETGSISATGMMFIIESIPRLLLGLLPVSWRTEGIGSTC